MGVGRAGARVGSSLLAAIDEYQTRFPTSTPPGPILVTIDFSVPASAASDVVGLLLGAPREAGGPANRLGKFRSWGDPGGPGTALQRAGPTRTNGTGMGSSSGVARLSESEAELSNWLTGGNSRYRLADTTLNRRARLGTVSVTCSAGSGRRLPCSSAVSSQVHVSCYYAPVRSSWRG